MTKLTNIILVAIFSFGAYINFKNVKRMIKKEYEEEDKLSPEKKEKNIKKQDNNHKIFITLITIGLILTFLLKNTFLGFFIAFSCLVLSGKVFFQLSERWTKNQRYNIKFIILSLFLSFLSITSLVVFFWSQLEFFYPN